ncbi:MAG: chromosomal replication initiator protein DnaA [Bacilli bacterium]|nr:chromosomal replication initiator protein DnaA [Bacilli bacterium]
MGLDYNQIWDKFLNRIKGEIEPINYETWFEETKLIEINNNKAKIQVSMPLAKKHIKEVYNNKVTSIFNEITESNFELEYYTEDELETNIIIDTDKIGIPKQNNYQTNLEPKYTFDTFLLGKSNKFAKATAVAVAQRPGQLYNPLFIYGPSGVGKTHLMHAIGNYIVENSNKKVLYVTADKFIDDFVKIFQMSNINNENFKSTDAFKSKYRDVDVLIIDDIQFLQEATKTQVEFFNTFNELHSHNKQIILSSDRSPNDLKYIEDRLRTRFNWGITVDILPPDFDLRVNIINKTIKHENLLNFPEEVTELIASTYTTDIRSLEGCITRVLVYAACMNGANITLELAQEALNGYIVKTMVTKNKIDQVQQIIAQKFNITVEDLKSKKRKASISYPRQIAMYICREFLEESLTKIGNEFGGKDHTTVMHSVDKIKKEIKKDKALNEEIKKIVNRIR